MGFSPKLHCFEYQLRPASTIIFGSSTVTQKMTKSSPRLILSKQFLKENCAFFSAWWSPTSFKAPDYLSRCNIRCTPQSRSRLEVHNSGDSCESRWKDAVRAQSLSPYAGQCWQKRNFKFVSEAIRLNCSAARVPQRVGCRNLEPYCASPRRS